MPILSSQSARDFVPKIHSTHSARRSAMSTLKPRSARLRPRRPIKAFCHFCQPTLPHIVVTHLEEDKHLVGQSLFSFSFILFSVRQLYDPVIS
jgi:hypothetical protein